MTIIIKVGKEEKLRFEPHLVGEDFVITPRRGRRFPIPIGSDVYDGDEFLGTVTFMLPEQFQRCRVMFDPPVADVPDEATMRPDQPPTPAASAAMRAAGIEVGGCGDVPEEGSIAGLELTDRLLDVLGSLGLGRLLALRSALARGDEFMLSLAGIGPKSLGQIKWALEQLEQGETPAAGSDG